MPHDLIGKSVRRLKGYAPSCGWISGTSVAGGFLSQRGNSAMIAASLASIDRGIARHLDRLPDPQGAKALSLYPCAAQI